MLACYCVILVLTGRRKPSEGNAKADRNSSAKVGLGEHEAVTGSALYRDALERLESEALKTLEDHREAIAILERALEERVPPGTEAKIHRLLGEIWLKFGFKEKALGCFEKALDLNPKAGVKKLRDRLEGEKE